jgi:poly(3-hydroxybutyrate) depolymerase
MRVRVRLVVMTLLASACYRTPLPLGGGAVDGAGVDATSAPDATRIPDATPDSDGGNSLPPGAGCGRSLPAGTTPTVTGRIQGYTQFTVMGTGANLTDTPIPAKAGPRTFWVRVPADYDPQHAYRVVFIGDGCGDRGMANMYALQLFKEAAGGTEQAIYVAIDNPPNPVYMDCYDNNDGPRSEDWEAFDLFMSFVDEHYCADLDKVYVVGYSTGATLANQWGCYFAGTPSPPRKFAPRYHVRGQVALWGYEPPDQPPCGGPVAGLWMHGTQSSGVSPETDVRPSLVRVGRANGCDTTVDNPGTSAPWHGNDTTLSRGLCQQLTRCPADHPVVFCRPDIALQNGWYTEFSIPAITTFFDEIEAAHP